MAEIREKEEIYLPQETIHHIQSFLNTKESAQTTLLSKSWLAAWSTRPVLIFDEDEFPETNSNVPHPLPILCEKTLNRYKLLDLKVDKFVLRMNRHSPLAAKFIKSALTLGVNEIVLRFDDLPRFVPFRFSLPIRFNLPAQVFASTTLTRLSVDCSSNCRIDEVTINRVLCPRLTSLILRNVCMKDDVMRDILLGCPLIENLDLDCNGLQNINVSKLLNLVEFRVGRKVRVEFMDGRKVTEFHHLRKLDFSIVTLSDDFFTKFPFMFPCIEDFTLKLSKQSVDCQVIDISSDSLRHLSLVANRLKKVQLNVPNITKFKFQAHYKKWRLGDNDFPANHFKPLPSLSFDNVSRDWECDVQLQYDAVDVIDDLLFEDLRKFLIQLTNSRISLCVAFFSGGNIMFSEDFPYSHSLPAVENLTVCDLGLNRSEILLGLSRICCSKVITICKSDCCFCT